jgi:hypothetical protein
MDEPAPLFFSIEAAERYVGFSIPHPRDLQGWRLEDVALLPAPSAPTTVSLTYRSETEDVLLPPSPFFVLEVPAPGSNRSLEPLAASGAAQRIYLGAQLAVLQSEVLVEETELRPEYASAVVQWSIDGRPLLAKALVREDSDVFGAGFNLDRFLAILESVA